MWRGTGVSPITLPQPPAPQATVLGRCKQDTIVSAEGADGHDQTLNAQTDEPWKQEERGESAGPCSEPEKSLNARLGPVHNSKLDPT